MVGVCLVLAWFGCRVPDEPEVDDTEREAPDLDTDGDGIADLVELDEGTDPDDPASASAWHPEVLERPRLLLQEEDLPRLKERLQLDGEPWSTLRGRLDSACARDLVPEDEDLISTTINGNTALSCAVLYAGGDLAAGDKGATVLESMSTGVDFPLEYLYKIDLHAGQGLLQGVRAWDLLMGVGYPDGHDPAIAEERLHELGAYLWAHYVEEPWAMRLAPNNHATKLASSLGILGMGLNDDWRSARYVNLALGEVPRLHDGLFASDGGYAEGPSYLVYAMQSLLPWLIAQEAWQGDESVLVNHTCVWQGVDCGPELKLEKAHLHDSVICDGFDRFVETLMPSGYAPNTDDANLASAQLGLTSGLCNSETQRWGWQFQSSQYSTRGSVDLTADTLLWWEDGEGWAPPLGPLAYDEAGWAILRDGWERDSSWAMILAEKGVVRSGGIGHEHYDPLAFLWASGGEYLLIDCGYGSWETNEKTKATQSHNLLLVDGAVESSDDIAIVETRTEGDFQLVVATDTFLGVTWTRKLAIHSDGYLFIVDETVVTDGGSHVLDFQLHGASDDLLLDNRLATWSVGSKQMELMVIGDEEPTLSTRSNEHSFTGQVKTHQVLVASRQVDDQAVWLTVAAINPSTGMWADDSGVYVDDVAAKLTGEIAVGDDTLVLD